MNDSLHPLHPCLKLFRCRTSLYRNSLIPSVASLLVNPIQEFDNRSSKLSSGVLSYLNICWNFMSLCLLLYWFWKSVYKCWMLASSIKQIKSQDRTQHKFYAPYSTKLWMVSALTARTDKKCYSTWSFSATLVTRRSGFQQRTVSKT